MRSKMLRLEEYTGLMENTVAAVYTDAQWLPTEFMLTQYITRILVVGRTAATSAALAADPGWTQAWRSPGAKEWSCLLGVVGHLPGPVLIVVGPDVVLTPKVVEAFPRDALTVVLRSPAATWPGPKPSHIFFPSLGSGIQDWVRLDPKVVAQLTGQGCGLVVVNGAAQWFKPEDSTPLTTLTTAAVAATLRALGVALDKLNA